MELRAATPTDGAALASIYGPYVSDTPISFETEPPDPAEMARRVASTLPGHPFLVAVEGGGVIGYAYGGTHRTRAAYRWAAEVSVYVDGSRHRTGAGRALYGALLRLLTAQGYRRALAGITLPNAASAGFHEAMGFRSLGVFREIGWKQGAWHDVGWWQLDLGGARGDKGEAPGEPRSLDALDPAVVVAALRR